MVNPNKLNKFAIDEETTEKWGINQSKHKTDKYGKREFEGDISCRRMLLGHRALLQAD